MFEACLHSCGLLLLCELQIPLLYHRHLSLTLQIVLQLRYDQGGKNKHVLQMFVFADLVQRKNSVAFAALLDSSLSMDNQGLSESNCFFFSTVIFEERTHLHGSVFQRQPFLPSPLQFPVPRVSAWESSSLVLALPYCVILGSWLFVCGPQFPHL